MKTQKEKSIPKAEVAAEDNKTVYELISIVVFFLLAMIFFRGIFSPDNAIVSTDYDAWAPKMYRETLLSGQWQKWMSLNFAGIDFRALFLYPSVLFLLLFNPHLFIGWEYAFDIFLIGTTFYIFMRSMKMSRFAAFIGGISMMFTNHVVSLVFPGHMGKLDLFVWTPLVFMFYGKALTSEKNKFIYFTLAGLFYGLQFLAGDVQIGYYIGLCLGIYTIYICIKNRKEISARWLGLNALGGLLTLLVTVLLSAQALMYFAGVADPGQSIDAGTKGDSSSQYEFATSWSFPPEEVITFFMQRPMGNMTGDGYWGRNGSAQTVLKLSDDYIGVLPLLLVLVGLVFYKDKTKWFWFCLGAGCLLVAFGGYTPLYKLIYKLPAMKSFRAPTKWTYLFVFNMCILVSMGADYLYKGEYLEEDKKKCKKFIIFLGGLVSLVIIGLLTLSIFSDSILGSISSSMNSSVDYSLLYSRFNVFLASYKKFCILSIIASVLLYFAFTNRKWKNYIFSAIAIIIVAELWMAGSYFIQYVSKQEYYSPHPAVEFLKQDKEYPRVKIGPQNGLISNLASNQFKYYQILCWDSPASRLPLYYQNFQDKIGKNDFLKFMDVAGIKYLISAQPLNEPIFQGVFNSYGVYIYQYVNYIPHAYTITNYRISKNDDEMLKTLANPQFNIRDAVLLDGDPQVSAVPGQGLTNEGLSITRYSNNEVRMSVSRNYDSILVLADYYYPGWKAYVDNKETKIYRANYLTRAIKLPQGNHIVRFVYEPSMLGLYITLCTWIVLIVFLSVWGYITYKRKDVKS
jgi:hypothetical protein